MIIPDAGARKALFIIDVQSQTLSGELPKTVTQKIAAYIKAAPYDAYVLAEYHAPPGTMFEKQGGWTLSAEEAGSTDGQIIAALQPYRDILLDVKKTTRSCFKGKDPEGLKDFLKQHQIGEIHFVGFDINDCVLASAYEAIDLGFFAFVLEELAHNNAGHEAVTGAAIDVLRHQNMTNNSLIDAIGRKII